MLMDRLRPVIRHFSTVTVAMLALIVTMMAMACVLASPDAVPDRVTAPPVAPVLMHNVSGTDNPLLLLLAAMLS